MGALTDGPKRRFQLVLIKPSHYDDDGYVIQWLRSGMPSNSLAAIYGLAVDAAERQLLGPDVAFDLSTVEMSKATSGPSTCRSAASTARP